MASILVFLCFGITQAKDRLFSRPRPAYWRFRLCVGEIYALLLFFVPFQTPQLGSEPFHCPQAPWGATSPALTPATTICSPCVTTVLSLGESPVNGVVQCVTLGVSEIHPSRVLPTPAPFYRGWCSWRMYRRLSVHGVERHWCCV